MNKIKNKIITSLFFIFLFINLIRSDDRGSSSSFNSASSHSGSTWQDGNGDTNSEEYCPLPGKLCSIGSYRDTDEKVHLVRYCVGEDEDCCGCNSILTPHYNITTRNTTYIKVGSCFGCKKGSSCQFSVFKDGLQRYCVTPNSSSHLKVPLLFMVLLVLIIIV